MEPTKLLEALRTAECLKDATRHLLYIWRTPGKCCGALLEDHSDGILGQR